MKAINAISEAAAQEAAPTLDEEFLLLVDRAMVVRKQCDPYRLEQVNRVAAEEARLANLTGSHESKSKHRRDLDRV
jgi:hypothetical protein